MAITAGHAWNSQTQANGSWANLLPANDPGIRKLTFGVDAASVSGCRVAAICRAYTAAAGANTIHGFDGTAPTTYFVLGVGEKIAFESTADNPIIAVYVQGDTGTATISGTVTRL